MIPVRLLSVGKAVPSRTVSSESLDASLGRPPGYTFKKSGVRSRFFAAAEETQSQLGAAALHDALRNAALQPSSIELLIAACGVPEQALPNTACFISAAAGLPAGTPAFDVNASCLSFLAAMQVAAGLLASGAYARIAIVSSDLASRGVDWDDVEASLIFGDGAAAVILEKGGPEQGIRAARFESYPAGRQLCEIRGGGTKRNPRAGAAPADYLFRMDGKGVFKMAVQLMPAFLAKLMDASGVGLDQLDVVVPHQASALALLHTAKKIGVPEAKLVRIYETHGNQVAASIPTALYEAVMSGRAGPGKRVLMIGTAAGLTLGGMIVDL
ncbi:MAG: ketoacyl-ACP synthase III [Pseudomonadota bacterium]